MRILHSGSQAQDKDRFSDAQHRFPKKLSEMRFLMAPAEGFVGFGSSFTVALTLGIKIHERPRISRTLDFKDQIYFVPRRPGKERTRAQEKALRHGPRKQGALGLTLAGHREGSVANPA